MKLLLDTHTFLWFIAGDSQLNNHARQLIENTNNKRYLSIITVWEITIKSSLGRLTTPMPPSDLIREHVWANAIDILPIKPEHLDTLYKLPYHHNDPFDRLLIAQAIQENIILITKDRAFSAYDIHIEWGTDHAS